MKIETFQYNQKDELASNTYVVIDDKRQCVVIDPSINYDGIVTYIQNNKLKLKGVLLTHGHYDHFRGVDRLINKFGAKLYCHNEEVELLKDTRLNCSEGLNIVVAAKPTELWDGDKLKLLKGDEIKVIHTPYHTKGGVCYYFNNSGYLFSGDSLFKLMIGRDDLASSCPSFRKESLAKLIALPEDTKVYPGHGASTTIGFEKQFNRFLKR